MVLHISSNPIWMSLPDRMEHAAAFVMLHIELLFAPRCVLVLIYFTLLLLNSWRLGWELVGLSRLFFPTLLSLPYCWHDFGDIFYVVCSHNYAKSLYKYLYFYNI